MVWTILQVSFRRLKNNRSELLLTFLVPILFFSIFALIFGSRGTSGTSIPKIKIALSDQNPSDVSRRAIELLREQTSLRITDAHTALLHADSVEHELARLVEPSLAEDLVRRGSVSAAVVFSSPTAQSSFPTIQLLADSYDQVSGQVLSALVQKSVMTAFAEEQRKQVPAGPIRSVAFAPASNPFPSTELPTIQSVDILGSKKTNPVIAMYARGPKKVLFLGMNPGPWGMAQTGVPFGEVEAVRGFLKIKGTIGKPPFEHPKRPIQGFACTRSEVSGRRMWGLFQERFGSPESFFAEHFVVNYCPLVFMDSGARNLTPDKLPAGQTEQMSGYCDEHLERLLGILRPETLVGVGQFAEQCFVRVAKRAGTTARILRILHPSPASPAANRGWSESVEKTLVGHGIWEEKNFKKA